MSEEGEEEMKNSKESWLIKHYSNRWNKYYAWVTKYFNAKTKKERIKIIKKGGLYLP